MVNRLSLVSSVSAEVLSGEYSEMVDGEVENLRDVLRRALAFALDGSGERRRVLRLRQEEAWFYGIAENWRMGVQRLEKTGRELLVEIIAAAPGVSTVYPDLEEPLEDVEQTFTDLVSAIVDVELDEPATVLWKKERDDAIEQIRQMKAGKADSATCGICGTTYLVDPDRLRQHFEHHHLQPGDPERRLRPVEEQIGAVQAAGIAFREAYDRAISCLTSYRGATQETGEMDPAEGGRKPHPWRDIMRAMARKRIRDRHAAESQGKEASALLGWAKTLDLPLDPGQRAPSPRTVEDWVRQERENPGVKRSTEPS